MLRYGAVGLVVLAADFATFAALVGIMPTAYLFANLAGKIVGAATGFVLHKYFTFSWSQKHQSGKQLISYTGLMVFNLAQSTLLLWLLVAQLGCDKLIAKIMVDLVVIATSFVVSRFWIYRPA